MQEEDRINYSKQIKSAQQGWKEMEGGRGRLGRFPVDTTAKYLRRAVGLGGGGGSPVPRLPRGHLGRQLQTP